MDWRQIERLELTIPGGLAEFEIRVLYTYDVSFCTAMATIRILAFDTSFIC